MMNVTQTHATRGDAQTCQACGSSLSRGVSILYPRIMAVMLVVMVIGYSWTIVPALQKFYGVVNVQPGVAAAIIFAIGDVIGTPAGTIGLLVLLAALVATTYALARRSKRLRMALVRLTLLTPQEALRMTADGVPDR